MPCEKKNDIYGILRTFVIEGVACQPPASHSSITNFLTVYHLACWPNFLVKTESKSSGISAFNDFFDAKLTTKKMIKMTSTKYIECIVMEKERCCISRQITTRNSGFSAFNEFFDTKLTRKMTKHGLGEMRTMDF